MGFGAVIASDGDLLDQALVDRIVEVRVEQTLASPTVFAIRFQDDACGGTPEVLGAEELETERVLTVAAPAGDELVCLVHGPIEGQRSSFGLGGPGSWVEVLGRDRRAELDRESRREPLRGTASDAMTTILRGTFDQAEVASTTRTYSENDGTLNRRGTDLQVIERLAQNNGLYFWLEYECRRANGSLRVRETARVQPSPERSASGQLELSPREDLRLRLTPTNGRCHTITRFELDFDTNRPTRSEESVIDAGDLEERRSVESDPTSPIERDGEGLSSQVQQDRVRHFTLAGGEDEVRPRVQAMLAEAGWFVHARASTTAQLLGGVLVPHQVVKVEGVGPIHSGAYQIESVTHVINATGHLMDLELRRNALGRRTARRAS
jgi:hypothetical protein